MQICFAASDHSWSVREVSQCLRVPERTVRHWASTGVLRARKFGKLWKFCQPEVHASARRLGRNCKGQNGDYYGQ